MARTPGVARRPGETAPAGPGDPVVGAAPSVAVVPESARVAPEAVRRTVVRPTEAVDGRVSVGRVRERGRATGDPG
ncbi:hypothetical protein, partial [Streptomyces poriticola]|uniref:hypothetical protein n=1 Tax=Streptomyces poriticola TaxID=3120506 RepID=UPI002FCE3B4A